MGLKSVLSKVFGTDEVISTATKGVYNGLDKAFYTSEERAGDFLALLKAYEPFKLIQRLLALMVGLPYVSVYLLSMALFTSSLFMTPCQEEKDCIAHRVEAGSKKMATMNNETLGTPFAIIMALYFGGGAINSLRKK